MRRTSPAAIGVAVLLALLTAAAAVRALVVEIEPRLPVGAFGEAHGPEARAMVLRLSAGLIEQQVEDGGFELPERDGHLTDMERISTSAVVVAALAQVHALGEWARTPELETALHRGLSYLVSEQEETGPIGQLPLAGGGQWHQVDATSAATMAFVLSARPEDAEAFGKCGEAMARFARGGLRNGWSRSLAAMTVDRVFALGQNQVFRPKDGRLVRGRDPGDRRDTGDWRVAEAIVRLVLLAGRDASAIDPYPGEIVGACLASPPRWNGQSSDLQSWWMRAWLVARAKGSGDWFVDLLKALRDEALLQGDRVLNRVPGGNYADSLLQTASALLATIEGLGAQPAAK